jgi:hypothetical protein
MRKVTLELPSWINKEKAKEEVLKTLLEKALLKTEYYRSKINPFERKYSLGFYEFKKKVESSPSENFEEWDDLIEWEAYTKAYEEWKKKYDELSECLVKS